MKKENVCKGCIRWSYCDYEDPEREECIYKSEGSKIR